MSWVSLIAPLLVDVCKSILNRAVKNVPCAHEDGDTACDGKPYHKEPTPVGATLLLVAILCITWGMTKLSAIDNQVRDLGGRMVNVEWALGLRPRPTPAPTAAANIQFIDPAHASSPTK